MDGERQSYGPADGETATGSVLEPTARLLHRFVAAACLTPGPAAGCGHLLRPTLDQVNDGPIRMTSVDGFLGEGLPRGSELLEQGRLDGRQARHDAAYVGD